MTGWEQVIVEPVKSMLERIAVFVPILLGAILILLAGWIVARVLSGLVQKGLEAIKFNEFCAKIGFADLLTKGNVALSSAGLIASLVYWAIIIVVLAVVVDALGLRVAAHLLEKVSGYIPNVASAIFVAIVGMFLGNLVSGVVKAAAANANLPRAEFLGSIAKGSIILFTAVIVLEELNIASFFVTTTFHVFFAAVCLALALAFGLGGKDLAAKILWDFFNRQNMSK